MLVWGVFRFRLLDLLPVARTKVFERITDGVLVVDAYRRIVDVNPAARRMLGPAAAVGHPAWRTCWVTRPRSSMRKRERRSCASAPIRSLATSK
ncbi:MAG: PAS domain-containing protein [Mycobacterium leprae]